MRLDVGMSNDRSVHVTRASIICPVEGAADKVSHSRADASFLSVCPQPVMQLEAQLSCFVRGHSSPTSRCNSVQG